MSMRCVLVLATVPAIAHADSFGGFSAVERHYLVGQDKVCIPLTLDGTTASGAPSCQKAGQDALARLAFKDPIIQRGPKATFTATASGSTLTVTRKASAATVLTWSSVDPLKVVDVFTSQYEDRVAVTYSVRRMGREVIDVIAFDLGPAPSIAPVGKPTDPTPTTVTAPPEDPKLTAAVATARKATKRKAVAAWRAVLAIDSAHSEAQFQLAAAQMSAKQRADALATLEALAKSTRADAIEWLVEARFAAAFASVRGDQAFRRAVGLDRKPAALYERVMGFGGQWEQTGTACDRPEIRLGLSRDRAFKLRVKTACQGSVHEMPFKGTWRIEGQRVVLSLPNKGKQTTAADEAGCDVITAGDEDSLHCQVGRDLDFTVLPSRR